MIMELLRPRFLPGLLLPFQQTVQFSCACRRAKAWDAILKQTVALALGAVPEGNLPTASAPLWKALLLHLLQHRLLLAADQPAVATRHLVLAMVIVAVVIAMANCAKVIADSGNSMCTNTSSICSD